MNEVMGNEAMNPEHAAAENSGTGKYIAIGVATAMLALGAGLGYVFGNKRGLKRGNKEGEESAKSKLKEAVKTVEDTVHAATAESPTK